MPKFDADQFIADSTIKGKSDDENKGKKKQKNDVEADDIEVKSVSKPQSNEGGDEDLGGLFVVQESSKKSGFEEVDLGKYKANEKEFTEQRKRKVSNMEEVLGRDKKETRKRVKENIHGVEPQDIRKSSPEKQIMLDPEEVKRKREQHNRNVSESNQKKISEQIVADLLTGAGRNQDDLNRSMEP